MVRLVYNVYGKFNTIIIHNIMDDSYVIIHVGVHEHAEFGKLVHSWLHIIIPIRNHYLLSMWCMDSEVLCF